MKQDGDKKDLALELAKIKAEDELQRDEQAKNKAKASIFLGGNSSALSMKNFHTACFAHRKSVTGRRRNPYCKHLFRVVSVYLVMYVFASFCGV